MVFGHISKNKIIKALLDEFEDNWALMVFMFVFIADRIFGKIE